MNIAYLFNSDHEMFNGLYGFPILKNILETKALQSTNRNIKISVGDILTFSVVSQSKVRTNEAFYKLNEKVYTPQQFNYLIQPKLCDTSKIATVYCVYIKNILKEDALELHKNLIAFNPYLGAMDINFNNELHAYFFELSLIPSFRIFNKKCSIFYSMNEFEEIGGRETFQSEEEVFTKNGFDVIYEDIGAHGTIFDNYYANYDHLSKIQDFKDIFSTLSNITDDILDNVVISLEELHPKLFNAFTSMARTFSRIESEEDIAQCSISGRRFLEQLANYLFPPQKNLHNGRKVGKTEYKNRIWAYISDTVKKNSLDKTSIDTVGKKLDEIIDNFNTGLHGDLNKMEISALIEKLLYFIIDLVNISPQDMRKPYLAHEDEIEKFMNELKVI